VIAQIATVALIVVASRWLFRAGGAETPRIRGNTRIYPIKWQWRAVGFMSGIFCGVLAVESLRDLSSTANWVALILLALLALSGLLLGIGSITTDESGITKNTLGHSSSLRWGDITEIKCHKKQGGAIEIRAGSRKLIADSRFIAAKFLLEEITEKSHVQPAFD